MTEHLRKVHTGDPLRIPARAYNAFVDAAELARRIDADTLRSAAPGGLEHLVRVRNDSGEDLPRFGVLGIAGPIIDPADNADEFSRVVAIAGEAVTAADEYVGRFAVAREPIAAGRIGLAVVRGVTPAIVDVVDQSHTHADTAAGEPLLRSGFTGAARLLWAEPGTGQRLALVEVGPAPRDRFPARLGAATLIAGRTFGWLYAWQEMRLDADASSSTYGQYLQPLGALSSATAGGAFNRYEAHLSIDHTQGGGTEGFAHGGACLIPGALENCPPRRAAVPLLHPIPQEVVVELRAERTLQGDTRFVFEALNPIVLTDFDVPGGI